MSRKQNDMEMMRKNSEKEKSTCPFEALAFGVNNYNHRGIMATVSNEGKGAWEGGIPND